MPGVTLAGFQGRSLDETYDAMRAKMRARLGASLTLIPASVLGQITGVMAEEVSDTTAMGEAVYLAFDESAAAGDALDNLAAITGTERLQATPSTVVLTATGTTGTVLPAFRVAAVEATGIRFSTTVEVTLAAAGGWLPTTAYFVGNRVTTTSPTPRVYQCVSAGVSAASGSGPAGTGDAIADGTVVWKFLGPGNGVADVPAECTDTGPVPAVAGSITQMATPVAGWQSVVNLLDAVRGRAREQDGALRLRRRAELRGQGNSTLEAMRVRVSDEDLVPGVRAVTAFENVTDTVNADGMPGHSVELMVEGGSDDDIRAAIWASKPAGIRTWGNVVGSIVDSSGMEHEVRHSRPTIIDVYVEGHVLVTPEAPTNDAEAIAQLEVAVVTYGDALIAGRDVVWTKVQASLAKVSWVFDVQNLLIGTAPGSLSTDNIVLTQRQRADFDTARITLTLERVPPEDL